MSTRGGRRCFPPRRPIVGSVLQTASLGAQGRLRKNAHAIATSYSSLLSAQLSRCSNCERFRHHAPSGRTSPRRKDNRLPDDHVRRAMVLAYSGSAQPRGGVDIESPAKHPSREDGFGADAIDLSKRGRIHIGIRSAASTAMAYNSPHTLVRTHTRHR